jgi:ribosomal protein S18 acetylase RimI-like enzyme
MAMPSNYTRRVIHIRVGAGKPSDIAEILDFWAIHAENDSRPTDSSEALLGLISRDPEALILAIENDEIVGTVIAGWNGWRCCLYRLAVRKDKRKQGIGKLLVDHAIERFKTFGGTRIDAMILDENETAHKAWASYGFDPQDNWSRWIKNI